jgi:diacylglycerol kinase family enzyme
MRAVIVMNPKATTTSPRTRDILVRALGSDLKLDVAVTRHRGHAIEIAAAARTDGLDVVIALGGDGTVNEVVNGLLTDGPGRDVPTLGVVPGGSTNVFARALGLPFDAVEATSQLLDAVRERRKRSLGLGRVDERWFTFCAGMGLDAEVVHRVEEQRAEGHISTHGLYVRSTLRHFYTATDRRHPPLALTRRRHEPVEGLHLAIVSNTAPWTYLGRRPLNPTPLASFDTGLDVFALRSLRTVSTLRHLRQLLDASGRGPRGRDVVSLHDVDEFTITSSRPVVCQVDGDVIGERSTLHFRSVPHALEVLV